jgi:hypothetical protein
VERTIGEVAATSGTAFGALKRLGVEIDEAAMPSYGKAINGSGKESIMGDKGGKKDKNKTQKQKAAKQEQQAQKKQEKQPKSTP